jgi:hypothetical protein
MARSRTRPLAARTAVVGLVAAVAAACGGGTDRPAADDWEPVWVRTEAIVPDLDELAAGGRDLCGRALGELRASREEVLPAPTAALDDLMHAWTSEAETLLFECPESRTEAAELELDLERQAGLVGANLQTTRGGEGTAEG